MSSLVPFSFSLFMFFFESSVDNVRWCGLDDVKVFGHYIQYHTEINGTLFSFQK